MLDAAHLAESNFKFLHYWSLCQHPRVKHRQHGFYFFRSNLWGSYLDHSISTCGLLSICTVREQALQRSVSSFWDSSICTMSSPHGQTNPRSLAGFPVTIP